MMLDELVKAKCEKALKSDGYVIVESNRLDEITNVHIESSVKETKCFVYYDGSRVKKIEFDNGFMIRLGNGDLVRYHKISKELVESIDYDYSDMHLGHTQRFMGEDMKVKDILELISSILSAETFEYNGETYKDIMYFKEAIVSWNKYLIDCVREYGENGSLYLDTFEGWEEVYPCKEFMEAVEECGYYEMLSEISRLLNNNNVDYVEYDSFDGILRIVEHTEPVEEEVEEPADTTTVEAEPVEKTDIKSVFASLPADVQEEVKSKTVVATTLNGKEVTVNIGSDGTPFILERDIDGDCSIIFINEKKYISALFPHTVTEDIELKVGKEIFSRLGFRAEILKITKCFITVALSNELTQKCKIKYDGWGCPFIDTYDGKFELFSRLRAWYYSSEDERKLNPYFN